MKKTVSLFAALSMAALCSCGNAAAETPVLNMSGELVKSQSNEININTYGAPFASKNEENANPLIANIFCADPQTAAAIVWRRFNL